MQTLLYICMVGAIVLSFASCQSPPANNSKSIVVTYSVLGAVVKDLIGDKASVSVLVPNGLDPHEWEPSAKDIEKINKADLVIENGLNLEGGLLKTLDAARTRGVKFFTASDHITVRHVGPGEGIPSGDPDQIVGAADPHIWTDPLTLKSVVTALAPVLESMNIEISATSVSLEKQLDDLNTEIEGIVSLIPQTERKLVTGHESMGYFAQRYGFNLIGVVIPSLSSQASVSAGDLAAVKQAIEANKVKAIFTELGTSPAVVNAIGSETGVKVVQLTTHALPPDGLYSTFMRNLANTVAAALK